MLSDIFIDLRGGLVTIAGMMAVAGLSGKNGHHPCQRVTIHRGVDRRPYAQRLLDSDLAALAAAVAGTDISTPATKGAGALRFL